MINEKERFDIANDTRKFEISLFWQRSLFFWGFIATAFAGYAITVDEEKTKSVALLLACFGTVCSFFWTLLNRGSKFWQENWEGHIRHIKDKKIDKTFGDLWRLVPAGFHGARKYSPSRLTIALSDYVVFTWVCALVYVFLPNGSLEFFSGIIIVATIAYIVWIWIEARSRVKKVWVKFKWDKELKRE